MMKSMFRLTFFISCIGSIFWFLNMDIDMPRIRAIQDFVKSEISKDVKDETTSKSNPDVSKQAKEDLSSEDNVYVDVSTIEDDTDINQFKNETSQTDHFESVQLDGEKENLAERYKNITDENKSPMGMSTSDYLRVLSSLRRDRK